MFTTYAKLKALADRYKTKRIVSVKCEELFPKLDGAKNGIVRNWQISVSTIRGVPNVLVSTHQHHELVLLPGDVISSKGIVWPFSTRDPLWLADAAMRAANLKLQPQRAPLHDVGNSMLWAHPTSRQPLVEVMYAEHGEASGRRLVQAVRLDPDFTEIDDRTFSMLHWLHDRLQIERLPVPANAVATLSNAEH